MSDIAALWINYETNEYFLFQGPPGTGKSLIGTILIQLLLENKHLWCEKSNYPILVICYTNSALGKYDIFVKLKSWFGIKW